MAKERKRAAIFHRIFLSHLLVLLLSFIAALILIDYMFADGIRHFLLRSPLILIPALLAMIGLAGLLALWTAGAIALPLDAISEVMHGDVSEAELAELRARIRVEEHDALLASLAAQMRRLSARCRHRPLLLTVDALLNVHDMDVDTSARLGLAHDARGGTLRVLFAESDAARSCAEWLRERQGAGEMRFALRGAGDRRIEASWLAMRHGNMERFTLVGFDVHRGAVDQ